VTNGTGGSSPTGPLRRSRRASARRLVRVWGAWLLPVSAHRRHSDPERALQFRAGLVGLVCVVTAAAAMAAAAWHVAANVTDLEVDASPLRMTVPAALALVAISVFAPQAIFRSQSAALTRKVLSNPSAPIQPWRSTTITFDAVLVGALLAGIYYDWSLTLLAFGAAFLVRILVLSRASLDWDPNARFHSLVTAWASGASGVVAFMVVAPLASSVAVEGSIVPLVLAALVAMYTGLAVNSVERWVNSDRRRWLLLRDAVDTRRIIVALVSAGIAWVAAVAADAVGRNFPGDPFLAGSLAGLGIFLTAWLLLWFVSIRLWVRDATRTLVLWGAHQSEVMTRIADGSLSPELAARAALPVTARMAVSVFAATRAMVVVDDGRGHVTTHLTAADIHPNAPKAEPRDLVGHRHLRLPLYPVPGHPNTSSITIARWLWAGWFITGSRRIVGTFTDLATSALLSPVIAANDDRDAAAFDVMFDRISRWPTLTAFGQAVERMQERADANPHTDSLLVGVYSIDDFGAIAGGRFEQAAVAQVMRLALGHQQFAGHDLFAAYEAPGRLWLALGGGPIIRNGISLLRGLQEHINDHGAVPSAKLDIDVHVSVSFGYAAHQVDDFTQTGLMAAALHRLAIDQGSRDPFTVENLIAYDIRPEDIMGELDTPITAVDTLTLLRADRDSADAFTTRFAPIVDADSGDVGAVLMSLGWHRSFGSLDLAEPDAFVSLVGRQPQLAAEATHIVLARLKRAFAETDALDQRALPLMVELPSILLNPDSAELALPNLVTPFLDRRECARTVILIDTVPSGGGQALRLLSDRGVHIAVTAAAAAGADPADLFGWLRWAIVFPQHVIQGASGVDGMMVQQTVSAIATRDTRLVGLADAKVDPRELAAHSIGWTISPDGRWPSMADALPASRQA